jgi:hypothetical protein
MRARRRAATDVFRTSRFARSKPARCQPACYARSPKTFQNPVNFALASC